MRLTGAPWVGRAISRCARFNILELPRPGFVGHHALLRVGTSLQHHGLTNESTVQYSTGDVCSLETTTDMKSVVLFLIANRPVGALLEPHPSTTSSAAALVSLHAAAAQHGQQQQCWDVDRYQSQHSFVWEYGAASLMDMLPPWPADTGQQRILDVGCGRGELTHALARRAPTTSAVVVMGMDADAGMVTKAQAQYPDLHFFQGDVRNFELPAASLHGQLTTAGFELWGKRMMVDAF